MSRGPSAARDGSDLAVLSACDQCDLVASGAVKPSELVASSIARIKRLDPRVNAVCTFNDRALDEAGKLDRRLERGEKPGPLCGLAVGIKDITPVAGLPLTHGSVLYRDQVAQVDAVVVERLRAAGAVVVGKTNTSEFAAGANTFNEIFGPTRNPWNLELSAGGSTGGGAAALATGMIALAEGTDLGGSLRIPASFCGVVGLRPSPGLVPTWPSHFLWDTLAVTGPMARTAEDVALMLDAIAGPSRRSPITQPRLGREFRAAVRAGAGRGRRVAYCPDIAGIGVDSAVEKVARDAVVELRRAGVEVEEVELDLSAGRRAFLDLRGWWMVVKQLHRLDRVSRMGENLRGNVEAGLKVTTEDLGRAEHDRARIYQRMIELLERYDHLLTPSMAVSPFPVEENYPKTIGGRAMKTYVDWIAPTFVLSLTSLPVASVPCGLDAAGMPVGLQIVGSPQGEEKVLALAALVQELRPIGWPEVAEVSVS